MPLAILDNEIAEGDYKQTLRSQSKCLTQRRLNTTMIGEPAKRGMHF
jgi:hypothetical protein